MRWAVVLAGYRAAAPSGLDADRYATACLTDSYEVLAGLHGVRAALAGPRTDQTDLDDIRWPADPVLPTDGRALRPVADLVLRQPGDEPASELIVVAGDVPDLPGLIIAKVAKALNRADVAVAPEHGGDGLVAFGVRLPWPDWLPGDLQPDLDQDCFSRLAEQAPRRNLVVRTPGWHRMRHPESVHCLDPGLEGWDNVRYLLAASGWAPAAAMRSSTVGSSGGNASTANQATSVDSADTTTG